MVNFFHPHDWIVFPIDQKMKCYDRERDVDQTVVSGILGLKCAASTAVV